MKEHIFELCDSCTARGQIEIRHRSWASALTLCGHHVRKQWTSLPDDIEIVIDEGLWLPGLSDDERALNS